MNSRDFSLFRRRSCRWLGLSLIILAQVVALHGLERNRRDGLLKPTEVMKAMNVYFMPDSQQVVEENNVRFFDSAVPIRSTIESVWEVLTDYENIEKFQPGIEESGLLPPFPGGDKQLEQQMVQRFLLYKKRLHLVVRIVEKPPHRIEFSIIEGDFKTYDGAWIIDPTPAVPRLQLVIRVEPNFFAPGPVLDYIVRSSSEKSLLSVVKEAERREK